MLPKIHSIENHQEDPGTILSALNPPLRYLVGLFASSGLAFYFVQIVMALTGLFNAGLTSWLVNFITINLLVLVNVIGNKIDRLFTVNLVFGVIISCYMISLRLRTGFDNTLAQWRLVVTIISYFCCVTLNAWLLTRYLVATGLKSSR